MSVVEVFCVSTVPLPAVTTGTIDEAFLTETPGRAQAEAWNRIIDRTLIKWGCDPSQLDDEGMRAPTAVIIGYAGQVATSLRDKGCPAATWIVPNGEGGVTFEWHENQETTLIEIQEDRSIRLTSLHNHRVIADDVIQMG